MRAIIVVAGFIALLGMLYLFIPESSPELPETPATNPEARARWEFERTKDPVTGQMPAGIKQKELAFSRQMAGRFPAPGKQAANTWTQVGPDTLGGRTRALAIDVTDNNTLLAGAVSGGIWKSTDGGANWTQTLSPTQLLSVTSIAQDTRVGNTDTWYAGTGELSGNSASGGGAYFYGDGIYKSTDGGDSWTLLASTATNLPQFFDHDMDFIWRIVTDASNLAQDEVYAAAYSGIYRSVDGGTSWTEVLSNTGSYYSDVVISSTGVLYAALSHPGGNAGIWRSTDGTSWTNITPGGWSGNSDRTVLALAPSNEDVLYTISNTPGDGTHDHSIWKYTHSTTTWVDRSANVPGFGSFSNAPFTSQGGYDLHVAVKPDDENFVFIGGTSLYRSTDGFASSSTDWIAGYSGASDDWSGTHHADQHIAIFSPSDPDVMYTGSDGGVHRTNDNTAPVVAWTSLNRGYLSGQFYSVTVDHTSTTNMALLGGTQDNGTWFVDDPTSSTLGEEIWGGDGAYVALLNDGALRYASFQNGQIYRLTYNGSNQLTSWALVTTSLESSYQFIHPYVLDPNDSDIMYLPGNQRMLRNTSLSSIPNYQSSPHTTGWQELSNTYISGGGVISAVVASESNPDHRVYFGTSAGKVYRIDNADTGNPADVDVTSGLFPGSAYVSSIAVHPDDADRVAVVFSNYSVKSIFYSDDAGATWTDVSGSLEENADGSGNGPSVRWIKMGALTGSDTQYFVGTSTGLYSTTTLNGTSTVWTQEGATSIGNVVVDMIDIRDSDGYIGVGTHGNGFYSSTLDRPAPTAGPGGVSTDLEVWLKADAGVTEASNNVSAWADQSGNGYNFSDAGASPYTYDAAGINYNPDIVNADGSNRRLENTSAISLQTVALVTHPDNANGCDGVFSEVGADDENIRACNPQSVQYAWGVPGNGSDFTNSTGQGWFNGTLAVNPTHNSSPNIFIAEAPALTNIANGIELGNSTLSRYWLGSIAEVAGYSTTLSTTEREQVQTYLAIKYGISLTSNYLASDATTLWDVTANAAYSNDIAGIGRDDASLLDQKQSDSGRLTVALGTLAADNASNSNTFSTDLAFLILGHDNGSLTESPVTIGATPGQMLGRTWFAEETGEAGTLEVQFDVSGLTVTGIGASEFYLVLDTDTDPTNGYRDLVRASTFASDIVTFTSIDIEDNDYVMVLTNFEAGKTDPPLSDGQDASGVLGQSSFNSSTADNGGVSASRVDGPSFIAIGPTGKLFVSDTDNNRVLRWSSVGAASNGSAAEAVLGQGNFTSSAANRGGSAAANTLYEPHGVFVSSTGALYVADTRNNRILRFDNAESAANGASADAVLGQADFTSNADNRSGGPAANTLRWPLDLYVDDSGHLWVSDWLNHRVLRYDNVAAKVDGAGADGVLGQDAFTTSTRNWKGNTDADSFVFPSGICVDSDGILWVADAGNSRVLRFDNAAAKADGADADGVLGQPDFTSWRTNQGGSTSASTMQWPEGGLDVDRNGRLWVADRWGDRVLWYHNAASKANGAAADGVIGQPNFTSRHGSVDNDTFNSVHDVLVDESNDYVWVVDNNHNRILRFDGADTALGKKNTLNLVDALDFWLIAGQEAFADQEVEARASQYDQVYVWLDQGRHQFTVLADTPPVFLDDAINGHPAIRFGADARMRIEGGIFGESTLDEATVWAVVAEKEGGWDPEEFSLKIQDNRASRDTQPGEEHQEPTSLTSSNFIIGGNTWSNGSVAELIATYQASSDQESAMIGTYLAIKYGVPFEQNYLDAFGDTLWDRVVLESYGTGIAGIGRNDAFGLMQVTSRAAGEDNILSVALPASITDSLALSPFIEDQTFTLWGHNGEALAIDDPTNLPDASYRMQRTWYIKAIGSVDSLRLSIPAAARAQYLLIDNSPSFANPTVIPLVHSQNATAFEAYLDVNRSAYFTFAAAAPYMGYGQLPSKLSLHQNYPNPFNPSTTISFDLPQFDHVYLDVYDILGRRIRVLVDEELPAGTHKFTFDAANLASGVYFYRMKVQGEVQIQKMLLAK